MQPLLPLLIISGIVVVAVFALIKYRVRPKWGFKDVVKNPDYWEYVEKAQQEVDSAARDANWWSNDRIAASTRQFVLEATSSRDSWGDLRILRSLEDRTHPTVLELLRDPNLYARLVKPTGEDILPEAPFNRACDLLGDTPPPEAVEALAPFLGDPSEEIRKDAALAIAKTGAPTITGHVRKAFSDSDEYVRSYALMGLEFALNRSRLAANVSNELFPDVLALLDENKNSDKAAKVLFGLNAGRATEFFLSPAVFTADSPILRYALNSLVNAKVSVPRERLLQLIASMEAKDLEYPQTYALGEALFLLSHHQRVEDRDMLRAHTNHPDKYVARWAASGLLCLYGLQGYDGRIMEAEKRSGYEALPDYQRFYRALFHCDAEINNGGLAQYFVNSCGDHWGDAVAAFEVMGFKERLDVLKEAIALFGSDGPSSNRSVRQGELSKLYKKNDSIFEELDSRYYASSEDVEVFASRFILANADGFR